MASEFPDLSSLTGVVAPEILNAMHAAAAKLESSGINMPSPEHWQWELRVTPGRAGTWILWLVTMRLPSTRAALSPLIRKSRFASAKSPSIPSPLVRTNLISPKPFSVRPFPAGFRFFLLKPSFIGSGSRIACSEFRNSNFESNYSASQRMSSRRLRRLNGLGTEALSPIRSICGSNIPFPH